MSLTDKAYEAYWSVSGLVRPVTLAAYLRERREADREWEQSRPHRLDDLGTVSSLSILPLVDFYAAEPVDPATRAGAAGATGAAGGLSEAGAVAGRGPGTQPLKTEPGVSYLIKADDTKILFDVAYNARDEHPSPLLNNMALLGVSVHDLDAVVISHLHLDHVGGPRAEAARTFALSAGEVDLGNIPAYTPVPMNHASAVVEAVTEGRRLSDGVASSGPIARAIWLKGMVREQALVINVRDKGVVLIVGCGHPSIARLVQRARDLVDAPLHGIVGGLHFPVTGSRVGKGRQNIIGSGKPPWRRISKHETREALASLAAHEPSLVALSAHDSCDWTLELCRATFGSRYQELLVGREIVVA